MKVELAQIKGRDGDTAYNLNKVLKVIATCAADTELLIFPETYVTGFPTRDTVAQLAEPLNGSSLAAVHAAARARNVSIAVGIAEVDDGRYFNTTVLITPEDGVALHYRKTQLWSGERNVFQPGDRLVTAMWKGIRIGLLICYDIEFPETARALGQLGAQILIVTNGNFDPYGPTHRTCIMARALENQAFAVMVNRVGQGDDGLVFAGGSCVVDPFGDLLVEAGREETRICMELDLSKLGKAREPYVYTHDQCIQLNGEIVERADRREFLIPLSR
jgi:(R)-amidase